jgi:hypothetical protein
MALHAGEVQTDPTDSLVTEVDRVEEAATVAEEVVRIRIRIIKRQTTTPRTVIPLPVPMTKAISKATTTDMVVHHHLKTLTTKITPLLVHILLCQNSLVLIRITHPTKVRSEAMTEVFVSCIGPPFAVSAQRCVLQGVVYFPSLSSSPPMLRGYPMRFS